MEWLWSDTNSFEIVQSQPFFSAFTSSATSSFFYLSVCSSLCSFIFPSMCLRCHVVERALRRRRHGSPGQRLVFACQFAEKRSPAIRPQRAVPPAHDLEVRTKRRRKEQAEVDTIQRSLASLLSLSPYLVLSCVYILSFSYSFCLVLLFLLQCNRRQQ